MTIHDAKPLSDESTARRRHIREGANPLVGKPCCVPQVIGFWRTPVEIKILSKVVCTDAGAMVEAEEVVSSMEADDTCQLPADIPIRIKYQLILGFPPCDARLPTRTADNARLPTRADAGAMVEAEEVVSSMEADGPYTAGVQTGPEMKDLHPHRPIL